MSADAYMALRAQLNRVRAESTDNPEEAEILARMDNVWRYLSTGEQTGIRKFVDAQRQMQVGTPTPAISRDLGLVVSVLGYGSFGHGSSGRTRIEGRVAAAS